MALNQNDFNVTLSPDRAAAAKAAIAALSEALDFTVELPARERRCLLKMGVRSEAFVEQAREVALTVPELMPGGMNVAELDRAAALWRLLVSLEEELEPLMTRVRDSRMLAGADLMKGAMVVYRSLKAHGRTEELRAITRQMSGRFERLDPAEEETPLKS